MSNGQVFTTRAGTDYTVSGLEWGRSYQFRVNIFPVETTQSSVIAEATTYATTATTPLSVPDAPDRRVRGVFEQLGGVTVRVGCSQDGSECGYRCGEYGFDTRLEAIEAHLRRNGTGLRGFLR